MRSFQQCANRNTMPADAAFTSAAPIPTLKRTIATKIAVAMSRVGHHAAEYNAATQDGWLYAAYSVLKCKHDHASRQGERDTCHDSAVRLVHEPADIGRQLLRLRPGRSMQLFRAFRKRID